MGRLGGLLLKGLGFLVVAMLALAVVGTIVGIVFGVIAAVVSLAFTVAVLAVIALAAVGLFSLFGLAGGDAEEADEPWTTDYGGRRTDDRDLETRLRERYVAGEIDEAEYERKLELLLGTSDVDESLGRSERDSSGSVLDRLRE